jgi:hypothetical protein
VRAAEFQEVNMDAITAIAIITIVILTASVLVWASKGMKMPWGE